MDTLTSLRVEIAGLPQLGGWDTVRSPAWAALLLAVRLLGSQTPGLDQVADINLYVFSPGGLTVPFASTNHMSSSILEDNGHMAIVAYARVSTRQQDFQTQVDRLKEAGAEKVFTEKRSGLDGERPELGRCLEYVREGDTLIVTKLDRLARSTADLYRIVSDLQEKGVGFKVLDDSAVDTTTRTGKLVMGILALIAEFETEIRKERQMEGIAKAREEGRVGGRPPKVTEETRETIRRLRDEGESIRAIAAKVGFSKATVQKALAAG